MTDKKDYPSNSNKSKEIQKPDVSEKRNVEPVAKAKVKKKSFGKKFLDGITNEDVSSNSVGDYILYDILIPAAKNTISDIVTGGIQMVLFGERRNNGSRPRNGGYKDYNKMYPSNRNAPIRPEERSRYAKPLNVLNEEIIFEDRASGEYVIDSLIEIADQYEYATLSDLYSLTSIDSKWTDNSFGWTVRDLYTATISRERDGYHLNLPRARSIK